MQVFKKFLRWLFGISSLVCLWNALKIVSHMVHRNRTLLLPRNLLHAALLPALTIILAMAWWTLWREKPSGKAWGITACLAFVLLPAWASIASRSVSVSLSIMFAVGVLGLVVLLWPVPNEPEEDDNLID